MGCKYTYDEHGKVSMIACSRGASARCACGGRKTRACDYPLRGKAAGRTCDAPLCARCAVRIGPNLDHCPAHARHARATEGSP